MTLPPMLRGTFCLEADDPCLAGHFPGRPVVPAVLLLESLAALVDRHGFRISEVVDANFHVPLAPAQTASLEILTATDEAWRFAIRRSGQLIASGRLRVISP